MDQFFIRLVGVGGEVFIDREYQVCYFDRVVRIWIGVQIFQIMMIVFGVIQEKFR